MTFLAGIKRSIPAKQQNSIAFAHLLRLTKERKLNSKRELLRILNEQIKGHKTMMAELAGPATNNAKRRQIAGWLGTLENARKLAMDYL